MPEASSGSTPHATWGTPPQRPEIRRNQVWLPSLPFPPGPPEFSPTHHSSGVLSPHPSSYRIINCSQLDSGDVPTLRGTAPPVALCSGLGPTGHTCSAPQSPAGPPGKSGPGNASLKELEGWGRFSGMLGRTGGWGGSRPGFADSGLGRPAEHKLPHPLLSPPTPPCRFPPGGGLRDAGLPG